MGNCSNCRHYYGKVENYRYFCCAVHPHGLPAEDCPDWQPYDGINCRLDNSNILGLATRQPEQIMQLTMALTNAEQAQRQYERELKRMQRHNQVNLVLSLSLVVAVVLNWGSLIKRVGCF